MKVTVYRPMDTTGRQTLEDIASGIRAEAIVRRIKKLHCPDQQKTMLIEAMQKTLWEELESQSVSVSRADSN